MDGFSADTAVTTTVCMLLTFFAVTLPLLLIVAAAVLLLDHFTPLLVAFVGVKVNLSCADLPAVSVVGPVIEMLLTAFTTAIVTFALFPLPSFAIAVIITVSNFKAVTFPVAIFVLLDIQVTSCRAFAGVHLTESCSVLFSTMKSMYFLGAAIDTEVTIGRMIITCVSTTAGFSAKVAAMVTASALEIFFAVALPRPSTVARPHCCWTIGCLCWSRWRAYRTA